MSIIEVVSPGWIQGRNGLFDIVGVRLTPVRDGTVVLDGIGKRGVPINGGLCFSYAGMTELARKHLEAQGYAVLPPPAEKEQAHAV